MIEMLFPSAPKWAWYILYLPCCALLFRAKYNKIFRDLAVLGYLSQLMPPVPGQLSPLHSLTPYQVIRVGGRNGLFTDKVLEALVSWLLCLLLHIASLILKTAL